MSDIVLDIVTGLGSVATAILASFLLKQTRDLKKQSKLAYGPRIIPRFIHDNQTNTFHIHLCNVGKGNATDLNLELMDVNNNPIGKKIIQAYTLLSIDIRIPNFVFKEGYPEMIDTGISFKDKFTFKIKGWYRDVNMEKIDATTIYEYPPKLIERKKNRFQSKQTLNE